VKQNLRRITVTTFVIITLVFVIWNAYTSYTYFTVYAALKNFSVTIRKFDLEILNASIRTGTVIGFENPSQYTFDALSIVERLSLQGEFLLIEGLYRYSEPLRIDPMSDINVTIHAEITDKEKIEWIKKWQDEDWLAEIRTLVNGPLVGKFLHDQWVVTKAIR